MGKRRYGRCLAGAWAAGQADSKNRVFTILEGLWVVDNNVMHACVGFVGHLAAIALECWRGLIQHFQKLFFFFLLDFLELTFLSHRLGSHFLDLLI